MVVAIGLLVSFALSFIVAHLFLRNLRDWYD